MSTEQLPRSWKEKQRQEREALILRVAEAVFAEQGYHGTSMDEIAARVGIAKGTVYLHFPSKEELIIAIFMHDIEHVMETIDAAVAQARPQTPRAKLEAIMYTMHSSFFSTRGLLLRNVYDSANMRKLFLEKGDCAFTAWKSIATRIATILEEGKVAGEFDKTIPTNVMLSAFFTMQSPKQYQRLVIEDQMSPEDMAHYLRKIYFKGIAASPEDSSIV